MAGRRNVLNRDLALRLVRERCRREDGHLLWLGKLDTHGSPVFIAGGKTVMVRRFLYDMTFATGEGPAGPVYRTCAVKRCVNPQHAALGRGRRHEACKRGHRYTPETEVWLRSGKRTCRICINEMGKRRAWRRRQRQEQERRLALEA